MIIWITWLLLFRVLYAHDDVHLCLITILGDVQRILVDRGVIVVLDPTSSVIQIIGFTKLSSNPLFAILDLHTGICGHCLHPIECIILAPADGHPGGKEF